MQKHKGSVLEYVLSGRHVKIHGLYTAFNKPFLTSLTFLDFFQSKKDLHSLKLPVNPKENKVLS